MKKILSLSIFIFFVVCSMSFKASAAYSETFRSEFDEVGIVYPEPSLNYYDTVNLSSFGLDYDTMVMEGIYQLNIGISIDIAEVDDGYQLIYIYSNSNENNLLYSVKIEHGSGYLKTVYSTYTYLNDNDYSFTINLTQLNDSDKNTFYIKYGAEGKYFNVWTNKNVKLTINPITII